MSTPLLELGVVLRARRKSATKGDSTVKLRPCRWSQLDPAYFADSADAGVELKIEADWAGSGRQLAAAMTAKWSDGRVATVQGGNAPVAALFTDQQLDFLARCARGRVNLAAATALPTFRATRWDTFAPEPGLSIRAERWTVDDGPDFLELSLVSTVDQAETAQAALRTYAAAQGLTEDPTPDNKTQRILTLLTTRL